MLVVSDDDFQFNDEMFLHALDIERGKQRYGDIWFALYSKELVEQFKQLDERAKALKAKFLRQGLLAVGIVTFSLTVTIVDLGILKPLAKSGAIDHRIPRLPENPR